MANLYSYSLVAIITLSLVRLLSKKMKKFNFVFSDYVFVTYTCFVVVSTLCSRYSGLSFRYFSKHYLLFLVVCLLIRLFLNSSYKSLSPFFIVCGISTFTPFMVEIIPGNVEGIFSSKNTHGHFAMLSSIGLLFAFLNQIVNRRYVAYSSQTLHLIQ